MIRLDANESPFNSPDNLYPDDELISLKEKWGQYEHIPSSYSYFCNGTEEAVDLCIRVFAEPYRDEVLSVTPTRNVYRKRAFVNRVKYVQSMLSPIDFSLDSHSFLRNVSDSTKLIFLCSPNSPTGNRLERDEIEFILKNFQGYVVLDESYIDFCMYQSNLTLLNKYRNLIVLRSFSHGWSSAGARLAVMIARPDVITQLEQSGYTHPLNSFVIRYADEMLSRRMDVHKWVRQIVEERTKVIIALKSLPLGLRVYPSEANFVFVTSEHVNEIYHYLLDQGISVRLIHGGLRISIGLPRDNSALLAALRQMR